MNTFYKLDSGKEDDLNNNKFLKIDKTVYTFNVFLVSILASVLFILYREVLVVYR